MVRSPEHQPKSLSSYVRQLSHHESTLFIVDYETYEVKKVDSSITHRQNNFWPTGYLARSVFPITIFRRRTFLKAIAFTRALAPEAALNHCWHLDFTGEFLEETYQKMWKKTTKNHGKTMVSLGKNHDFSGLFVDFKGDCTGWNILESSETQLVGEISHPNNKPSEFLRLVHHSWVMCKFVNTYISNIYYIYTYIYTYTVVI